MSISTIISKRVRKMSQRERAALNIGLLVLIWGLIDSVTIGPALTKKKIYLAEIAAAHDALSQLEVTHSGIDKASHTDPDAASRARIEELEDRISGIDDEIRQSGSSLVPASDMPKLLDEIISRGGKVKVVSLETLPRSSSDEHPGVTAHSVRVVFEGKYLDLIERLHEVESSRWKISWDEIDLSASGTGTTQISVTVHTLSLEDAWLNV